MSLIFQTESWNIYRNYEPIIVANMLDCDIVVIELKLLSRYYVHFRTLRISINPFYLSRIVLPKLFYKDCFGIRLPTKIDMPLNKETKNNSSLYLMYL